MPQERECSWGSVFQVAFLFSRISRVNSANVVSSTRKCNTAGSHSLGIPRGALQSPLSDAVNQAGGARHHAPAAAALPDLVYVERPKATGGRARKVPACDGRNEKPVAAGLVLLSRGEKGTAPPQEARPPLEVPWQV